MVEIVIIPAMLATIAWVIYVVVDGFRRRQQLRLATDFHGRLLDRIGSAKEFGEFLNTNGGTKFLDALSLEKEGGPANRILRAIQAGLVCTALGIGLFILIGSANLDLTPDGFIRGGAGGTPIANADENDAIATAATIFTSVGVGLILSAGASYFVSRRLGLLNGQHSSRTVSGHSA
jgi:hypothetical protein